ncbi:hypothetical protein C8A05DRAFT_38325 [Staphylotrichum tortipilum]|uniref:Uncharacterized protein n=1 Tax=Staphylotrichum tortipilum TaxID=2831512 RepID=A0AAN6MBW1_9PEZI|nr:hypothetical protein C8A05DRAFT_38325 [Staphylotrichum longicolle]
MVDPQDLFQGYGRSLESVTGSFVPELGMNRSVTPNDTPESSKDSGMSEPNSDITEGTSLDIDLEWPSIDNDLLWNTNSINMEGSETPDVDMSIFNDDSSVRQNPLPFIRVFVVQAVSTEVLDFIVVAIPI